MPRIRMGNLNDVEMVHSLYIEKILQLILVEHVGDFFSYKKNVECEWSACGKIKSFNFVAGASHLTQGSNKLAANSFL